MISLGSPRILQTDHRETVYSPRIISFRKALAEPELPAEATSETSRIAPRQEEPVSRPVEARRVVASVSAESVAPLAPFGFESTPVGSRPFYGNRRSTDCFRASSALPSTAVRSATAPAELTDLWTPWAARHRVPCSAVVRNPAGGGGGGDSPTAAHSPSKSVRQRLDDVHLLALESKLSLLDKQRELSAVRCQQFMNLLEGSMTRRTCGRCGTIHAEEKMRDLPGGARTCNGDDTDRDDTDNGDETNGDDLSSDEEQINLARAGSWGGGGGGGRTAFRSPRSPAAFSPSSRRRREAAGMMSLRDSSNRDGIGSRSQNHYYPSRSAREAPLLFRQSTWDSTSGGVAANSPRLDDGAVRSSPRRSSDSLRLTGAGTGVGSLPRQSHSLPGWGDHAALFRPARSSRSSDRDLFLEPLEPRELLKPLGLPATRTTSFAAAGLRSSSCRFTFDLKEGDSDEEAKSMPMMLCAGSRRIPCNNSSRSSHSSSSIRRISGITSDLQTSATASSNIGFPSSSSRSSSSLTRSSSHIGSLACNSISSRRTPRKGLQSSSFGHCEPLFPHCEAHREGTTEEGVAAGASRGNGARHGDTRPSHGGENGGERGGGGGVRRRSIPRCFSSPYGLDSSCYSAAAKPPTPRRWSMQAAVPATHESSISTGNSCSSSIAISSSFLVSMGSSTAADFIISSSRGSMGGDAPDGMVDGERVESVFSEGTRVLRCSSSSCSDAKTGVNAIATSATTTTATT